MAVHATRMVCLAAIGFCLGLQTAGAAGGTPQDAAGLGPRPAGSDCTLNAPDRLTACPGPQSASAQVVLLRVRPGAELARPDEEDIVTGTVRPNAPGAPQGSSGRGAAPRAVPLLRCNMFAPDRVSYCSAR